MREAVRAAHSKVDLCNIIKPIVAPGGVDSALIEKDGDADEIDNDNDGGEAQGAGQGEILV